MGSKCLRYTALTIAIIGAVNWGLIGFFNLNLVALLFRKHELGFQNRIWSGWNLRTLSSDLLR